MKVMGGVVSWVIANIIGNYLGNYLGLVPKVYNGLNQRSTCIGDNSLVSVKCELLTGALVRI